MSGSISHVVIERSYVGPITHVRLRGVIDETFSPQELSETLTGHVIVDLGGVERIGSFGVKQWMVFTRALPSGASSLLIINAAPVMVDQLMMVEGFAGVATILSVLAPYVCDSCHTETVRCVDVRSDPAIAKGEAPAAHVLGVRQAPALQ